MRNSVQGGRNLPEGTLLAIASIAIGLAGELRCLLKPPQKVASLPLRLSREAFRCDSDAEPMLSPVFPLACVRSTIRPRELALAMLFTVQEGSFVLSTVHPFHGAIGTHVVPLPLPPPHAYR